MNTKQQISAKQQELLNISKNYCEQLHGLWSHIFDEDMCVDNFNRLLRHANNFYSDLLVESMDKKKQIEQEIDNLKKEAADLYRLLERNVAMPELPAEMPLLEQQAAIDKNLQQLREALFQRQNQVRELLLKQQALCDELDETPLQLPLDPLPKEAEILRFQANLNRMKAERVERLHRWEEQRKDLEKFSQILGYSPDDDLFLLDDNAAGKLRKSNMAELQRKHKSYAEQVHCLYEQIDSNKQKLAALWTRLNTSPTTRAKYEKLQRYDHNTLAKLREELQRCEQLKRANLKEYIVQIRQEILVWWNKTLKSNEQRSKFGYYHNDCYSDDLLDLHELELQELKDYYNNNEKIFMLITERQQLWERMLALEQKANDPNRYNNRGCQLLKEEKERKILVKKLPKIEDQIKQLVLEYQERTNEPFLCFGHNILEYMANEWAKKKEKKLTQTTKRKQAQTPVHKSQLTPHLQHKNAASAYTSRSAKTPVKEMSSSVMPKTMPAVASQKRKLSAVNESLLPNAKRSLMYTKSSSKVPKRVISTLRHDASNKKRRSSLMKQKKSAKATLGVVELSTDDDADDGAARTNARDEGNTYVSFEPAARSSIREQSASPKTVSHLPKPRALNTPHLLTPGFSRYGNKQVAGAPKSNTKNLPILL